MIPLPNFTNATPAPDALNRETIIKLAVQEAKDTSGEFHIGGITCEAPRCNWPGKVPSQYGNLCMNHTLKAIQEAREGATVAG